MSTVAQSVNAPELPNPLNQTNHSSRERKKTWVRIPPTTNYKDGFGKIERIWTGGLNMKLDGRMIGIMNTEHEISTHLSDMNAI